MLKLLLSMRGFANEGLCTQPAAPGLMERTGKEKKTWDLPWNDRRGKKMGGDVGGRRTDEIQMTRCIMVTRPY